MAENDAGGPEEAAQTSEGITVRESDKGDLITIRDTENDYALIASVGFDGSVKFGEGYEAAAAAEAFWREFGSVDVATKWARANGYELLGVTHTPASKARDLLADVKEALLGDDGDDGLMELQGALERFLGEGL